MRSARLRRGAGAGPPEILTSAGLSADFPPTGRLPGTGLGARGKPSRPPPGPQAPAGDQDDARAGRVYTTAVGALCLEVYYRYLPMYGK